MTCRLRLANKQAEATEVDFYQATVQQRSIEVIQSEITWLFEQLNNEQRLAQISAERQIANSKIATHYSCE